MRTIATLALLVLCAAPARAQQAPSPQTPDDPSMAHYKSAAQVAAGVAALGNDKADVAFHVFQLPPYAVNAAHRAPVDQVANLHEAQAELFIVMDGAATMVTGGKLVGATRNGTNLAGKSIEGGTRQRLAKGDFFIVPAGVPHWFTEIAPSGLNVVQLYLPNAK